MTKVAKIQFKFPIEDVQRGIESWRSETVSKVDRVLTFTIAIRQTAPIALKNNNPNMNPLGNKRIFLEKTYAVPCGQDPNDPTLSDQVAKLFKELYEENATKINKVLRTLNGNFNFTTTAVGYVMGKLDSRQFFFTLNRDHFV